MRYPGFQALAFHTCSLYCSTARQVVEPKAPADYVVLACAAFFGLTAGMGWGGRCERKKKTKTHGALLGGERLGYAFVTSCVTLVVEGGRATAAGAAIRTNTHRVALLSLCFPCSLPPLPLHRNKLRCCW
jgi:hypothetical protein